MKKYKKGAEPPATDIRWWSTRLAKIGAGVAALVLLIGTSTAIVQKFDGRYALAGDVQQIQTDILQLRRDGLDSQRRDLQRAQRQRRLSDHETEQLQKLVEEISRIDHRLERLQEKK